MTIKDIDNIFSYHAPSGTQVERYEGIRNTARGFALYILDNCPDSREKSIAITKLQESVMFANAAIAINENKI